MCSEETYCLIPDLALSVMITSTLDVPWGLRIVSNAARKPPLQQKVQQTMTNLNDPTNRKYHRPASRRTTPLTNPTNDESNPKKLLRTIQEAETKEHEAMRVRRPPASS